MVSQFETRHPLCVCDLAVSGLTGLPYDARDRPFLERKLEELKMSAAQYQTHSLAIANRYYDKDLASEEKLRQLVDFCEAYATSIGGAVGEDLISDGAAVVEDAAASAAARDDDDDDHTAAASSDSSTSEQQQHNKKKRKAETEPSAHSKRQHIESKAPDSGHTFGAFAVGNKVTVWYDAPQSSALFWRAQITAVDVDTQTLAVHIRELVVDLTGVSPSRLTPGYLPFAT